MPRRPRSQPDPAPDRASLAARVVLAQEEDRRHIARELHDEIGQSLAAVLVGLTSLLEGTTDPRSRARIGDLIFATSRTIEDTRRLARGLRPALLDDVGLGAAVQALAADFSRAHGIAVDVQIGQTGDPEIPPPLAIAAYRICQEALTNVARHSEATAASVILEVRDGNLALVVEDNGRGFEAGAPGAGADTLGLSGMRERVELVQGRLEVESAAGRTTIYAWLPLEPS